MAPICCSGPPVKLKLIMSIQRARLLRLAVRRQIERSKAAFHDFSKDGYPRLAADSHKEAVWLERVDILLEDLIYNSRI